MLFCGEVSPAVTFTNLKYSAAVDIYEGNIHEEANDNVSTKAKGWSVLPALGSKLFLTRKLALTANIGYDIEFGSKLSTTAASSTHRRAHETVLVFVCRFLLEKVPGCFSLLPMIHC